MYRFIVVFRGGLSMPYKTLQDALNKTGSFDKIRIIHINLDTGEILDMTESEITGA